MQSEPEWEPLAAVSDSESLASEPAAEAVEVEAEAEVPPADPAPPRSVSFSHVQEVRRMPADEAAAATLSRLPYELWLRAQRLPSFHYNKLPVRLVAKLALHFCAIVSLPFQP